MFKQKVISFLFITMILLLLKPAAVSARVFPTPNGESGFNAVILRNLDEFKHHWGAGLGYCWAGRLSTNLECRQDGILGKDLLILQGELALIRNHYFALETGYHHTLKSAYKDKDNLIPVRVSFFFETFDDLYISPSITAWHLTAEDDLITLAFVGVDFFWDRTYSLGFELNVNQDFRYHLGKHLDFLRYFQCYCYH